jgi:mRNA interferase MazF
VVSASRFDVVLVGLDPTVGSEMRRPRPCVVISPDELNRAPRTVIVAPTTTGGHTYPWRVAITFAGKAGHIALDQVHTVDRDRLVRRLGTLDATTARRVLDALGEMFAP